MSSVYEETSIVYCPASNTYLQKQQRHLNTWVLSPFYMKHYDYADACRIAHEIGVECAMVLLCTTVEKCLEPREPIKRDPPWNFIESYVVQSGDWYFHIAPQTNLVCWAQDICGATLFKLPRIAELDAIGVLTVSDCEIHYVQKSIEIVTNGGPPPKNPIW